MARRLNERLDDIERQLGEIHTMLAQLLAATQPVEQTEEEPVPWEDDESPGFTLEVVETPHDPRQRQLEIVQTWAERGRSEALIRYDLSDRSLINIDLRGADLREAVLSRADFSYANLSRTNLSEALLDRVQALQADFSGTVLEKANMHYSNFSYTKLDGANLRFATLTRCNLLGANLSNCDFSGADLRKCNLAKANLSNAHVNYRQLAAVSSLQDATMPDGRIYDGDPTPYLEP